MDGLPEPASTGRTDRLIGVVIRSKRRKPSQISIFLGCRVSLEAMFPGMPPPLEHFHNRFTWAILKARTNNTAGTGNACGPPSPGTRRKIEFHYFSEGNDARGEDLDAVVAGVEFARGINDGWQSLG